MEESLILWAGLAYLLGSIPFSVLIGRLALGMDIRRYGDHNPGATNVLRAGGRSVAIVALLLDFMKGALPVGTAYLWAGWSGWQLALISIMPVLGHAFSPFLGFHGGKAVAVTGGIWCGLTAWEGPTIGGALLGLGAALFGANGWAVILAMGGMMLYFIVTPASWNSMITRPNLGTLTLVWIANMAILLWRHHRDLAHRPQLRRARTQPQ